MPNIAIAQLSAASSLEDNVARATQAIHEAASKKADLVLFPEIHLSPFFPSQQSADAEPYLLDIGNPAITRLREACRAAGVFASPNIYLRHEGGNYDTSLLIDRNGEIVGQSMMVHITQQPGFYEQDYYAPSGEGFRVFDTEIGKIGIVICFDRHYPESFRTCVRAGADLVLVPTANMRGEPLDLFAWEMRAAAFQNSVYIAMCNRVGVEEHAAWGGHSMVAGPRGDLILETGDEESIRTAPYDLEFVRRERHENRFLKLYRAEAFELS